MQYQRRRLNGRGVARNYKQRENLCFPPTRLEFCGAGEPGEIDHAMMQFRYRTVLLIMVSVLFVTAGETCGPEFTGLVFTREHGPDAPLSAFTKGKIGIPLPSWWRAYLVVAYRYLEGKPLSADEARSFAEFWGTEEKFGFPSDPANKALENWVKARAQYEPASPKEELKAYKE